MVEVLRRAQRQPLETLRRVVREMLQGRDHQFERQGAQ
jgi:hypothetical protein